MHRYCKAHKLGALREFGGWTEKPLDDGQVLSDDDICFIWDDFTVQAQNPFPESPYIFENVTPEWEAFCVTTLNFVIPEDLPRVSAD